MYCENVVSSRESSKPNYILLVTFYLCARVRVYLSLSFMRIEAFGYEQFHRYGKTHFPKSAGNDFDCMIWLLQRLLKQF